MPQTRPPSLHLARNLSLTVVVLGVALSATSMLARAQGSPATNGAASAHDSLARAVLAELLAINTAPSGGQMSRATKAMANRLRTAGYPVSDVVLAGPDAK